MHPTLPKTYPYNPKATTIILCILLFGACAVMFGWMAAMNDSGLILNGVITLSVRGATIFYWTLATLSMGFVLIGILLTIQRVMGSVSLEISNSSVRIPSGFLKRSITEIDLADVVDLSEAAVQGQRFFYLHTKGKKHCLNRSLMPSNADYEEAKVLITDAIVHIRSTHRD